MGTAQRKRRNEEQTPRQSLSMSTAIQDAVKPLLEVIHDRAPGQWFTEGQERAILQILAMLDGNIHRTSKVTQLGLGTIWQVRDRNMGAFTEERERWKKQHAKRAADVAEMALVRMAEGIAEGDISPRDAAVTWGILVQRGMDLAGEGSTVTHRVIHTVDQQALGAAMERLQAIRGTTADEQGETLEADFRVVE